MKWDLCEIVELFRKSFAGTIVGNERKTLDEVLENDSLRDVYDQLADKRNLIEKLRELDGYEYKPAFQELKRQHRRRIVRRWGAWGSAVAAIIIAVVLFTNPTGKQVEEVNLPLAGQQDILPGKKLAILKLADGRAVQIGQQSVEITELKGGKVKYEEGQLSYSSDVEMTEEVFNELEIPVGGECHVRLDDGTVVWLNADSRLKYPVAFVGNERRVILEGEAYFEVTKDKRPFIVHTQTGDVTVLGTSFGINAYAGRVGYTTLVEGQVRFTSTNRESVVLLPGEQAVAYESGVLEKRTVQVDEYVGWKEGILVFRDKSLSEIMETLQRWYGVTVIFRENGLKELKYSGSLERYDTINTFLQLLEKLKEIRYEITGNTIILFK